MKPVALGGWAAARPAAWGAEAKMPTKGKLLWVVLSAMVLATTGGATWYVFKRPAGATGPATALVVRRDLSATVTATGTIKAMIGAEVKVGSRIPGRVDQLAVQVGGRVKAGQMIARLEVEALRG
jgi:membrane fusion protein, macrolide-specific efflux system